MTVRELLISEMDRFAVMVAAAKGRAQRVAGLTRHLERGRGVFLVAEDGGEFVGGIRLNVGGGMITPGQPYIPEGAERESIFEELVRGVILYLKAQALRGVRMECTRDNKDIDMVRRCLNQVTAVASVGASFDIAEEKVGDELVGVSAVYIDIP